MECEAMLNSDNSYTSDYTLKETSTDSKATGNKRAAWQSVFLPEQAFQHAKMHKSEIRAILMDYKIESYTICAGFKQIPNNWGVCRWEEIHVRITTSNQIENLSALLDSLGKIFCPFAGSICIGNTAPIQTPVFNLDESENKFNGLHWDGSCDDKPDPGPIIVTSHDVNKQKRLTPSDSYGSGNPPERYNQGETNKDAGLNKPTKGGKQKYRKLHFSIEAYTFGEEIPDKEALDLGMLSMCGELTWQVGLAEGEFEQVLIEFTKLRFEQVTSVKTAMRYHQTSASVSVDSSHDNAYIAFGHIPAVKHEYTDGTWRTTT
ncbi:hypothetical protein BDQ17DRAFT_1454892 [Cyathus striatus]|nr:hypothetical protein BDQ17DRAFT_1454892 [Cyathus striatus]